MKKKTIKDLIYQLNESANKKFKNGFLNLRGGTQFLLNTENRGYCDNHINCSNTTCSKS